MYIRMWRPLSQDFSEADYLEIAEVLGVEPDDVNYTMQKKMIGGVEGRTLSAKRKEKQLELPLGDRMLNVR